jgi:hypothetical protein
MGDALMKLNQVTLINHCNRYLKTKRRHLILQHGYCHGLTLLWLFLKKEKRTAWFSKTIRKIITTRKFSESEPDIEKFISYLEWLQNPEEYLTAVQQMDMDITLDLVKELSVSHLATSKEVGVLLKDFSQENLLLCLSSPQHTVGIFKDKSGYFFYNANAHVFRPLRIFTLAALKNTVLKALFLDFNLKEKYYALTFNRLAKNSPRFFKTWFKDSQALARENSQGITALLLAVENNDLELVKYLLSKNISPNRMTQDGRFPLLLATAAGYADIVKVLLEHGAEPNWEGREGLPLYVACKMGWAEIVDSLLDFGASSTQADREGDTALAVAIQTNRPEIVKKLAAFT